MTEKRIWLAGLFCLATLISCAHSERFGPPGLQATETLITRGDRNIPVVLYGAKDSGQRKLAILAAGYGLGPTDYTFLSAELVKRGFVVAALPSHLKSDLPIPSGPDTAILRRPFWDNGVADIRQVIATLRSRGKTTSDPVVLVGHSHGGDIAMLLAQRFPSEVRHVFSLDNRRVALPRTDRPRICSVRSTDQVADPGVLPDPLEAKRLRMLIVPLTNQQHDDMWDAAKPGQRAKSQKRWPGALMAIRDLAHSYDINRSKPIIMRSHTGRR